MARLWRLSSLAREDLADIFLYTARTWGTTQADDYLNAIQSTLDTAMTRPAMWRDRQEYYPGLYSVLSGRHHIFFFLNAEVAQVARILHERRDWQRHLPAGGL